MAKWFPQAQAILYVSFEGTRSDAEGGRSYVVDALPKNFSVHRNGYKEADTFELSFDARALPFSPDIIRGAAVQIYGWNSSELYPSPQARTLAVQDAENRLIAGLVDEATIHFDGGGRFFRVSGRDYTALMLDHQYDPKYPVHIGKSLAETVQYLVDLACGVLKIDATGNAFNTGVHRVLTVVLADGVDDGNTTAADHANPTGQKKHVTKKGKVKAPKVGTGYVHTNKKGIPVRSGSNYWDVIYRLVINHGLIVYVDGTDVIISHPNVLTNTSAASATHVAYGRNLTSLSIERKLGKETVPQIKVISYDPKKRSAVFDVWPPNPTQKTTAIGTKKDEVQVTTALGLTTKAACLALAKLRYAALARAEATYHFETKDLADLNHLSLFNLKSGDAIRVDFEDLHAEDFRTLNSVSQRRAAMVKLGYVPVVAERVAYAFEAIAKERAYFYVKENTISYDASDGFSIAVMAMNFISPARDDQQ